MNALIIGGQGGLGQALINALRQKPDFDPEKDRVFLTTRRPEQTDFAQVFFMDLGDESSIVNVFDQVSAQVAQLDLMVVASGLLHSGDDVQPEKKVEDIELDMLRRSFEVNAFGPILLAKHFWPLLKTSERSVFAVLSARVSSISDNKKGGWYAYRSAKAALNMLIKTLSIEMRRRAPKLVCVGLHPGTVDTALSRPFQRNVPKGQLFSTDLAAMHLLKVIEHLDNQDSGQLFAWDGSIIEW